MPKMISVGLAELDSRPHALYRFFDRTDTLLYIGITMDFPKRMRNHRKGKPWWLAVHHVEVEHFENRRAALDAETEAIRTECPLYNDAQNQLIQAPIDDGAESYDVQNLARDILGYLEEDEREVLLHDSRYDFEGQELSEREIEIVAAQSALGGWFWDRRRYESALTTIFEYLPEGQWARCYEVTQQVIEREPSPTRSSWVLATAEALHTELASTFLATLPDDEREEWLECARNAQPKSEPSAQTRFAADYARAWKTRRDRLTGRLPDNVCVGAGDHGARCPGRAEFRVWQENCPCCEDERGGHTTCRRHHEMALAGEAERGDGGTVVIVRSAPYTDPWWI